MTGLCGIVCDNCPIHLLVEEKSETIRIELKKTIAEECFRLYGLVLTPEEITGCDGCLADTGNLFSGCRNCNIRNKAFISHDN